MPGYSNRITSKLDFSSNDIAITSSVKQTPYCLGICIMSGHFMSAADKVKNQVGVPNDVSSLTGHKMCFGSMVESHGFLHEAVGFVLTHTLIQQGFVFCLRNCHLASWLLSPYKVVTIIQKLFGLNNVLSNKQVIQVFCKSAINI